MTHVSQQLDRYLEEKKHALGQNPKKDELHIALRALKQEERRYVKARGKGTMSEDVYTDQMNSVAIRRKELQDLLNMPEEDQLSKNCKILTWKRLWGWLFTRSSIWSICLMSTSFLLSVR